MSLVHQHPEHVHPVLLVCCFLAGVDQIASSVKLSLYVSLQDCIQLNQYKLKSEIGKVSQCVQ